VEVERLAVFPPFVEVRDQSNNQKNKERIMSTHKIVFATFLLFPALFLGCSSNNNAVGEAADSTSQRTDSKAAASGGVIRQTPTPQSTATTTPSPDRFTVIATRPGSGGLEVDLTDVAVSGDVVTVSLRYRNITDLYSGSVNLIDVDFPIERVNITDDATSRRYGVLKDQSGQYMASPVSDDNDRTIHFTVKPEKTYPGSYEVAWFKFPAPPPEAQTISINVPKVAPFDKIRIQR
jgi:archaellum component FlaF (FlaF/FlaG flagellin family)